MYDYLEKKKENKWDLKKILGIVFGALIILRVLFWIFGDSMPKCGDKATISKLDSIIARAISGSEFDGVRAKFGNGKEISVVDGVKTCEAVVTMTDINGDVLKVVRQYEITKSRGGSDYRVTLK